MSNGITISDFTAEASQADDAELLYLLKFIEDGFLKNDIREEVEGGFNHVALFNEAKAKAS
jgi:hypothetical protein